MIERACGVYSIRNVVTGDLYIGSSVDIARRWVQHRRHLNAGVHHSRFLQRAWAKYGESAFVFAVIESLAKDKDLLLSTEQRLVDEVRPNYNLAHHVGSQLGIIRSDETRERIRQSRLGTHTRDSTKKLLSQAMTGRQFTDEWRAKISAARTGLRYKGTPCSEEEKRRRSIAMMGHQMSQECRRKISESKKGKKLGPMPIETRLKISKVKRENNQRRKACNTAQDA